MATAQKAAGDDAAATRLVDYLWRVQKADGSWWQNTRVNGEKFWTSLQLDETALPVVLAWWLGRTAPTTGRTSSAAADFIIAKGPKTEQERWENQSGWSPNTIATEIAGADLRADIARRTATAGKAAAYEARADEWQAKVESWTATSTGPYSPKPYYLRVTKDGRPRRGHAPTGSATTSPTRSTSARSSTTRSSGWCCSASRSGTTRRSLNSLAVGDAQLGVDAPSGRIWHRFTFDGYGETDARRRLGPSSSEPRRRRSVASGRCSPASAASTSCSPGAAPARTWRRSPTARTTA